MLEGHELESHSGERVRIVLVELRGDKGAAIERLMRHLGAFERDNMQKSDVANLSDDELMAKIGVLAERLGLPMPPPLPRC